MTALNALAEFASEPWVERLGWTLVHFMWQGLAIAAIYAAVRRTWANAWSPNGRYLLACTALASMLAAPACTWALLDAATTPAGVPGIHDTPPVPSALTPISTPLTTPPATGGAGPEQAQFLGWVVMIWLAGAVVFWARLTGGWFVTARMRTTKIRTAPPEWQDTLRRLSSQMGLARPVQLLVSALVEGPMVIGWLKPVVLVPVGALGGMPAEHLEALLLHELAHIRRHDYLVNMLQSVVEALLFYHPAVWWVSGHIRAEREMCCDDRAVSIGGDVLLYARALAQLESYRPVRVGALAAHGGSLRARIARLAGVPRPASRTGAGSSTLALAILLAAAAFALYAQPEEHPRFEVASIKPVQPGTDPTQGPMGAGYRPGGRFVATNMSLMLLIQFAYADHAAPHWLPIPGTRIIGGPSWINKEFYDIEAKPRDNTDPRRSWLMVQTLLADRFHLVLHRETRELSVYDLTVAKSGPKLPAAAEAGCVSFPPGTPPRQVPGKVDCGYVSGPGGIPGDSRLRIEGRKVHVSDLVRELGSVLDRPVLDRTGLNNEFDLRLTFTSSAALLGLPGFGGRGDPGGPRPTADADLPDIFAALEEQLGLKLVSSKGPVEVLVIDRAERPAAN